MVKVVTVKPEDERVADVIEKGIADFKEQCGRTPTELYIAPSLNKRLAVELASSAKTSIPGLKYHLTIYLRDAVRPHAFILAGGDLQPRVPSFSDWFGPCR